MARPVASGICDLVCTVCINVSGLEVYPRPRWRSARSRPHKYAGLIGHFVPQASGTPVNCQAISLSPPADIAVVRTVFIRSTKIFDYASAFIGNGVKSQLLRSTAQTIRASLLARATTTVLMWARALRPRSHSPSAVALLERVGRAALAP